MIIDTLISIVGLGYNYVTGIRQSKTTDKFYREFERLNSQFEKLSDDILYLVKEPAVKDTTTSEQKKINDLKTVKDILDPLPRLTGNKILSTAMLTTPEKMRQVFGKGPWQLLDSVRPCNEATPHPNKDMIPILFCYQNRYYIGWQMKGILPLLFDCEYNPESGLWLSKEKNSIEFDYVLSESVGIETIGKEFTPLIYKGEKLPTNKKSVFTTHADNQSSVELHILVGKSNLSTLNRTLGKFHFEKFAHNLPKGRPQIEVSFAADCDGSLTVSARDLDTNEYSAEVFKGIEIEEYRKTDRKKDVYCPFCSSIFRIPRNRHINANCPYCNFIVEIKNGIVLRFKEPQKRLEQEVVKRRRTDPFEAMRRRAEQLTKMKGTS